MKVDFLQAIQDRAASDSRASRAKNIAKGNPTAWRKVWEDALRKHYPESVVQYTDRVQHNLKQAIEKRGLPAADMCAFIEWIVANWPLLRQQVFSFNPKSPRGPEVPDLKAVIPFLTQVHALYMRSKPEIAVALPLAARRASVTPKPVASIAAKPKPAPATTPAPLNRLSPTYKPNHAAGEAARQRLGLPKWDEKQ
jgi:hypothetical protein